MAPKIGIIGGGFSGTMTIAHLVKKMTSPCHIYIVSEKEDLNRGIAYNTYSKKHILNVITGKMSAFPDNPNHFLDWVIEKEEFKHIDKSIIANSFISRKLYGDYLVDIWHNVLLEAEQKQIQIVEINDTAIALENDQRHVRLSFIQSNSIEVDYCVIASGNQIPKNPEIANLEFYKSPLYFQNPWKSSSVDNVNLEEPILIVGNGLTMVDTIIGLLERNYKGEIYSISPNGFNILPHRHSGMSYTAHLHEIHEGMSLRDLFVVVHRHIKIVREFGVSAEPIIDALRPLSQKLWMSLSDVEKKKFMARLRHLFGVARHRIPLHIYDKLQKMRIDGRLHILSGKLLDMHEVNDSVQVSYYDKKRHEPQQLSVSRVINCTGPETDFQKLENTFLSPCIRDGILCQDELKLGLNTNVETLCVKNKQGVEHSNLFTLGSNLKGELWESTAVNELRQQAVRLAENIVIKINNNLSDWSTQNNVNEPS